MKVLQIFIVTTFFLANSALAFNIPTPTSINPDETKLKACILQEAQQALIKGTLTKDNLNDQATKIAAACATKNAIKQDDNTVKLAVVVINSLLK